MNDEIIIRETPEALVWHRAEEVPIPNGVTGAAIAIWLVESAETQLMSDLSWEFDRWNGPPDQWSPAPGDTTPDLWWAWLAMPASEQGKCSDPDCPDAEVIPGLSAAEKALINAPPESYMVMTGGGDGLPWWPEADPNEDPEPYLSRTDRANLGVLLRLIGAEDVTSAVRIVGDELVEDIEKLTADLPPDCPDAEVIPGLSAAEKVLGAKIPVTPITAPPEEIPGLEPEVTRLTAAQQAYVDARREDIVQPKSWPDPYLPPGEGPGVAITERLAPPPIPSPFAAQPVPDFELGGRYRLGDGREVTVITSKMMGGRGTPELLPHLIWARNPLPAPVRKLADTFRTRSTPPWSLLCHEWGAEPVSDWPTFAAGAERLDR